MLGPYKPVDYILVRPTSPFLGISSQQLGKSVRRNQDVNRVKANCNAPGLSCTPSFAHRHERLQNLTQHLPRVHHPKCKTPWNGAPSLRISLLSRPLDCPQSSHGRRRLLVQRLQELARHAFLIRKLFLQVNMAWSLKLPKGVIERLHNRVHGLAWRQQHEPLSQDR